MISRPLSSWTTCALIGVTLLTANQVRAGKHGLDLQIADKVAKVQKVRPNSAPNRPRQGAAAMAEGDFSDLFRHLPNGRLLWNPNYASPESWEVQALTRILGQPITAAHLPSERWTLQNELLAMAGGKTRASVEELVRQRSPRFRRAVNEFERRDVMASEIPVYSNLVQQARGETRIAMLFWDRRQYNFEAKGYLLSPNLPSTKEISDYLAGNERYSLRVLPVDEAKARHFAEFGSSAPPRPVLAGKPVPMIHDFWIVTYVEGQWVPATGGNKPVIKVSHVDYFAAAIERTPHLVNPRVAILEFDKLYSQDFPIGE